MTNKEISYEICCIAESLNCLWVIDSDINDLQVTVNMLNAFTKETLDSLSEKFDTYIARSKLRLTFIKDCVNKLTIHPDEKGEWSTLKSSILNDLDKLINKLQ